MSLGLADTGRVNPNLLFHYSRRRRLNGDPVFENPFAPWREEDLFPWVELWDFNLAGYRELRDVPEIEEWLEAVWGSHWPLLFLIEQSCHDGELLDQDLRVTRLARYPLDAICACEEAIACVPWEYEKQIFFMIYWAVRIERARRRGRP